MSHSRSRSPHRSASNPCSAAAAGYSDADADHYSVTHLLLSEPHHMPLPNRPLHLPARQDSINWILKVHAHYEFSPVTAMLAVNYLDRFISSNALPEDARGWPFQLLSVACLSLAAKMEEPYVPLLLDLQLFDPRFVFDSQTVLRMELLVMARLDWRLRSVTPFDYLHHFISKLPSSSEILARVESISSDLIVSTTRVVDFLGFPPSAIAAAAVLTVASGGRVDFPANDDRRLEAYCEQANKEMVRSCHQLMEEYLIDTCPGARLKERRAEPAPAPPSPVGVLDAAACVSCDTRSENPGSSRAEPQNKR